jgi:hypothetical protein
MRIFDGLLNSVECGLFIDQAVALHLQQLRKSLAAEPNGQTAS